jgi:hypothetical protein
VYENIYLFIGKDLNPSFEQFLNQFKYIQESKQTFTFGISHLFNDDLKWFVFFLVLNNPSICVILGCECERHTCKQQKASPPLYKSHTFVFLSFELVNMLKKNRAKTFFSIYSQNQRILSLVPTN